MAEAFPLQFGGALIRKVEETALPLCPAEFFKSEAQVAHERASGSTRGTAAGTPAGQKESQDGKDVVAVVESVDWLWPHYMDEEGNLNLRVQMYVVETPSGKRIAVDTCIGNDKNLGEDRIGHMRSGPFLERLREAGCPPESIDFVLCTHLHFDHVGFNTVRADGAWVPTFPNARYLFAKAEWENFQEELNSGGGDSFQNMAGIFEESVRPVVDAGLMELVDAPCVVVEEAGARVSLKPTPGHTPGHVSVVVESQGLTAVITGDCIHHPVQMAHTFLGTFYDSCSAEAADTREWLLKDAAERRALIIGTHFAAPSAGYVEKDARGGRRYKLLPLTCQCCVQPAKEAEAAAPQSSESPEAAAAKKGKVGGS